MGHAQYNWRTTKADPAAVEVRLKSALKEIGLYSSASQSKQNIGAVELQDIYREIIKLEALLRQSIELLAKKTFAKAMPRFDETTGFSVDSADIYSLTERELEVLRMFSKGLSYKETAEILHCKVSTIQTHIKRIYKKLGVHSRAEAVFEFQSSFVLSE